MKNNMAQKAIAQQNKKEAKHGTKWERPKVMEEKAISAGPSKGRCLGWMW